MSQITDKQDTKNGHLQPKLLHYSHCHRPVMCHSVRNPTNSWVTRYRGNGDSSWLVELISIAFLSRWRRGKTPHQWTSKASCWTWGSTVWAWSRPPTSCASPTWLFSKEPSASWETPLYRYLQRAHHDQFPYSFWRVLFRNCPLHNCH